MSYISCIIVFMKKVDYDQFHESSRSQERVISKNNFTYRIIIGILDKYLTNKSSVLDIGCGAGTITFYLASQRKYVQGVDISKKSISICQKSSKLLRFDKMTSFQVVDFPRQKIVLSRQVDSVLLLEVIEHLKHDRKALIQIFNLLSKKGILVLSTPSENAPLKRLGLLEGFDKRVGHVRSYNTRNLVELCESIGFKLIHVEETEGIIRNFLFTNNGAGKLVRLIKYSLSDIVSYLDNLSVKLFGASDIFIILQKP